MRHPFTYLILAFLFVTSDINAQSEISKEEFEHFLNQKLYVVYDADMFSDYNFYIKDAVEKNWTITKTEFITYDVFDTKKSDPEASFLVLTNAKFDGDRSRTVYVFLNLVMGNESNDISKMPDICNIPLGLKDQPYEEYVYKLPAFIRFLQNHISRLKSQPELLQEDIWSSYKKEQNHLSNKTLNIRKSELADDIDSLEKIKSITDIQVKISSKNEIEKLIEEGDENSAFLHILGSEKRGSTCLKAIIGTGQPIVYYYAYHQVTGKNLSVFLKNDLQKLQ